MSKTIRVGVEVGGTFTDLVWAMADGSLKTGKVLSTPQEIDRAVLSVIHEANIPLQATEEVIHGSTIATNALLTRRGAQAGLITTAGFRDVIIIGRADRNRDIYNARHRAPQSPISRRLVREVAERIDAAGRVLRPLDLEQAWEEAAALIDQGVEGIAICLLHAYRNPSHEKALADLIRTRAPHVAVSVSHEVSPEFREYERTMTTAVNAFTGPVVSRYVGRIETGLRESGYAGVLKIMQSNGGAMPAQAAGGNAVRMLLSGPAAGVGAAMWFAERNDIRNVITLDMGGTSTDVAIAPDLKPRTVPEMMIDGLPVRAAAVDMVTIGAGGGSIAAIDPGGFLTVGPHSAGAAPGPACYDRGGTQPTVTDAQLVAGILRPTRFFGGRMSLRMDKAEAGLASLALGGGLSAAADGVLRVVNGNMAGAARLVSTARGIDPRDFAIVAFGGGGPLHAASVAEELDIRRVLVPWSPGLCSAFGLLVADTLIDLSVSNLHPLSDGTLDAAQLELLRANAREAAARNGLPFDSCDLSIGIDMRYGGQAFELTVWHVDAISSASALREMFEAEHWVRYGYSRPTLAVEVVGYRIRLTRRKEARLFPPLPNGSGAAADTAEATIGGRCLTTSFISRDALAIGSRIAGPAVIEEATATTLVPPGWSATCLATGDLLLERMQ
jgi:N-methylhydantoinase A